jgi:hypothetical protein
MGQIGVRSYEKAPFTVRTYSGCRFSKDMSNGTPLTCASSNLLNDFSRRSFSSFFPIPQTVHPRPFVGGRADSCGAERACPVQDDHRAGRNDHPIGPAGGTRDPGNPDMDYPSPRTVRRAAGAGTLLGRHRRCGLPRTSAHPSWPYTGPAGAWRGSERFQGSQSHCPPLRSGLRRSGLNPRYRLWRE